MPDENSIAGRVRRYAQVSTAVGGLAARLAGERYLGIGVNREVHAADLKAALGGLKGPLMKVAQILIITITLSAVACLPGVCSRRGAAFHPLLARLHRCACSRAARCVAAANSSRGDAQGQGNGLGSFKIYHHNKLLKQYLSHHWLSF